MRTRRHTNPYWVSSLGLLIHRSCPSLSVSSLAARMSGHTEVSGTSLRAPLISLPMSKRHCGRDQAACLSSSRCLVVLPVKTSATGLARQAPPRSGRAALRRAASGCGQSGACRNQVSVSSGALFRTAAGANVTRTPKQDKTERNSRSEPTHVSRVVDSARGGTQY